jgi:hypothetical protein
LRDVHRRGEGLVPIAQIDAAPARGAGECAIGPLSLGEVEQGEGAIFLGGRADHGNFRF